MAFLEFWLERFVKLNSFQNQGSDIVSKLESVLDSKVLSDLLQEISNSAYESAVNHIKKAEYELAGQQYQIISDSYLKAVDVVSKLKDSVKYKHLSDSFLKTGKYWQRYAKDFVADFAKKGIGEVKNVFDEGNKALANNDQLKAIELYDRALESKLDFDTSDIWVQKGNAFIELGRIPVAIDCFNKALEINPKHDKAWFNKGRILLRMGSFEEAIGSFDKVLEINPKDDEPLVGKGVSHHRMGQYDTAIFFFDEAIALSPNKHIIWFDKGATYYEKGSYDEAIKAYERATDLDPSSLITMVNLAEVYLLVKNYRKYAELMQKIRSTPEHEYYGFAISVFDIVFSYVNNNIETAKKQTLELLQYCKSGTTKIQYDESWQGEWTYDGLKLIVQNSNNIDNRTKKLIHSLLSLAESKKKDKDTIVDTLSSFVKGRPEEYSVKDHEAPPEIQLDNTSAPVPNFSGWYKWKIFIRAKEEVLSKISYVIYTLHPTFYEPVRKIENRKGGFELVGRGWGEFEVKVKIKLENQDELTMNHWLKLGGPTPLDS